MVAGTRESSAGRQAGSLVAVVVGLEGAGLGDAQVRRLLLRQLGQLDPKVLQVGSRHLLVQLQSKARVKVTGRP